MFEDKTILAIIPARGGSKGVPRKNIKECNGKPLISYTIEAAKKSKYIDRVIVSTDDIEIAEISKKYSADVPFIRPENLSADNSTSVDVVTHAVEWLRNNENQKYDYICLLQCTSPLRNNEDIDNCIIKLFHSNMKAILSVSEVDTNPYWTNVFNGEKLEYFIPDGKKITRRQDLPKIYSINGAIYVINTSVFLNERSFEPDEAAGFIMDKEKSIDIDSVIDFKIAEYLLKQRENNVCA